MPSCNAPFTNAARFPPAPGSRSAPSATPHWRDSNTSLLVAPCCDVMLDMDAAITSATNLSSPHTERLDARAIDLLHVACALTLESELFLTTDIRQAQLAKAAGLIVTSDDGC